MASTLLIPGYGLDGIAQGLHTTPGLLGVQVRTPDSKLRGSTPRRRADEAQAQAASLAR